MLVCEKYGTSYVCTSLVDFGAIFQNISTISYVAFACWDDFVTNSKMNEEGYSEFKHLVQPGCRCNLYSEPMKLNANISCTCAQYCNTPITLTPTSKSNPVP